MWIITGQEAADKLVGNYTVLELETHDSAQGPVTAYCVVEAEKIPLLEIPMIGNHKELHNEFIKEYRNGNYKFCRDAAEHLMGYFGGEVNSFYEEILRRIDLAQT